MQGWNKVMISKFAWMVSSQGEKKELEFFKYWLKNTVRYTRHFEQMQKQRSRGPRAVQESW